MNAFALPLALTAEGTIGPGETIFFWIVAPLIVIAASALLFAKKASYALIAMVFVMIGLATIYIAQDAMFLGMVQIIVYTGAILMLFLFVLMLIGVDAADSLVETIKGQRWLAWIFGIGLLLGLIGVIASATITSPGGLDMANADTNPVGIARTIFGKYAFAMELTGALLIVAALSAMALTHLDRIGPKISQREVVDAKMLAWRERGARIGQYAPPGVYARTNTATVAALGPDRKPVDSSVPRVLRIRGQETPVAEVAAEALIATETRVGQAALPGMPGEAAPRYEVAPAEEPPAAIEAAETVETPKEEN